MSASSEFSLENLELIEAMAGLDRYWAIGELVEALPLSEYPHALQLLQNVDRTLQAEVTALIERQWACSDPQAMWDYTFVLKEDLGIYTNEASFLELSPEGVERAWDQALALVDVERRQQLLTLLLQRQLPEDPAKVLQALSLVSHTGPFGLFYIDRALDEISSNSPYAIIQYLEANPVQSQLSKLLYEEAFRALAKDDRHMALGMAAELPLGDVKKSALIGSLDELAQHDLNRAIANLDSIPMDSTVYEARKALIRQIGTKDFESVKALIRSQEDSDVRREYYQNVSLEGLARGKSFDEVLEVYMWAEAQPVVNVWPNRKTMLYSQLVRHDLQRAADLILELPPGEDRMIGLVSLSDQLMKTDLQAVFDLTRDLSHVDERERILKGLGNQLLEGGVESAGAFLLKNDDSFLQRKFSSDLIGRWAAFDREAAHEWILHLTDPDALRSARAELVVAWGKQDPAATANYIDAEFDESEHGWVYGSVVSSLANEDPIAAVEWLNYVPEDAFSNESAVSRNIASAYIRMDSMAASEWIAELDSGVHRDAAIEASEKKSLFWYLDQMNQQ
jgi:hypothetical protein